MEAVPVDLTTLTLRDFGIPSNAILWKAGLLTMISLSVGILGGFVGLALGTIRLPALLLLGVPPSIAAGTNIIVSSLSAFGGAVSHWRRGRVDMRIVLFMGVPACVGAFLGGFFSGMVQEGILLLLVGLLVVWQGVEFIIIYQNKLRSRQSTLLFGSQAANSNAMLTPVRISAESGIGLGVGMLGGAVGLILGSIRLPAMIRILRIEPRIAAGTNLFIGFFMGTVGWVGHVVQARVDYPLMILMGVTAVIGSWYGAKLTGQVNLNTLILLMGFVLITVGCLLAYRGVSPLI